MSKYLLSLRTFADAVNTHPDTLRRLDRTGKFKAHERDEFNFRWYTKEQIKQFLAHPRGDKWSAIGTKSLSKRKKKSKTN